ncbi:MAG: type II toxin-antitoxin system ParD family antitoxin [Pirellulales bacterium]
MAHQIPPDVQKRIEAQIASGQFNSLEDVLHEALDVLERRQQSLHALQEMVREADADIAAGRVGPFDAEKTKKSVRLQLRERGCV